jgi:membrane protein CcdC involved in cytochrome C biogenesis
MLLLRLFALLAAAASAAITYYNWIQLNTEGEYSMRAAVLAPAFVVMGLFVFVFPKYFGKPETTGEKIAVMLIFAVGLAAGGYNLYLMDPSMFGQ